MSSRSNKISKGVKAYHACARSKGCGRKKSVAKKATAIQNRFKKDARTDKILERTMKAKAKSKLQQRLRDRKKKKMKAQGTSDRTNERQGEEIMELKKKVAKGKPRRKRRTKAQMAEARGMGMEDRDAPKKPVKSKPTRKRRTKAEMAEAKAMGREDTRSGGGGKKASFKPGTYEEEEKRNNYKNFLRDYFEQENEGYRDNKYMERRAYYDNEKRGEDRLVKLMDQAVNHAFRFTRKIFNIVKKRKFKTRKEFEEAFSKEIGY